MLIGGLFVTVDGLSARRLALINADGSRSLELDPVLMARFALLRIE